SPGRAEAIGWRPDDADGEAARVGEVNADAGPLSLRDRARPRRGGDGHRGGRRGRTRAARTPAGGAPPAGPGPGRAAPPLRHRRDRPRGVPAAQDRPGGVSPAHPRRAAGRPAGARSPSAAGAPTPRAAAARSRPAPLSPSPALL